MHLRTLRSKSFRTELHVADNKALNPQNTDRLSALGQTDLALLRSPRAAATGSDPAASFLEKRLL